MDTGERVKLLIYILFRISIFVAGVIAIFKSDWTNFALAVVTMLLTFLPAFAKREFNIYYPGEFEILILAFIYASMYLGEIRSFYYRFWWWDVMLHTLSGMIIGAIGFSLVYILNGSERIALQLSPVFVAVFSFSFALSIGALWEIYEYFMDSAFGLNMQKSGLVDTMWDLIVDALGALVLSILGYFYMKGNIKIFERLERRLIERNNRLSRDRESLEEQI